MKYGAFIQSNTQQIIGAYIAKHALETRGGLKARNIPVSIIKVEDIPAFQQNVGKPYRRGNYGTYSFKDLQSFTLTRFMPPELMSYEGRALVIDPDIYALSDVSSLFDMDMGGAGIAACSKNPWDTSVMVLDNAQLKHWNIGTMLTDIADGRQAYEDIAALRKERVRIKELPRIWNHLDTLLPETKMIHTTTRLTQPWKTGLPVDFTFNSPPKLFGIIPRFWVQHPTHYQKHPNPEIEKLFFTLLKETITGGGCTVADVDAAIERGDVRKDAKEILATV
jgi:hypothetical protein